MAPSVWLLYQPLPPHPWKMPEQDRNQSVADLKSSDNRCYSAEIIAWVWKSCSIECELTVLDLTVLLALQLLELVEIKEIQILESG
jgi:hypothetical protein